MHPGAVADIREDMLLAGEGRGRPGEGGAHGRGGTADELEQYIVNIVVATRNPGAVDASLAGQVMYGASPRAGMGIDRSARAHAWLAGRDYVGPEDIQAVAPDVLRHRLVLSFEAEADGVTADSVIERVLEEQDAFYRLLAGLTPLDDDVREVGIGGPGLETVESNPLFGFDGLDRYFYRVSPGDERPDRPAYKADPGYIGTDMVMAVPEKVLTQIIAQVPMGRLGGTHEVAQLVSFLASDETSFITGANYSINGGQHVY